MAFKTSKYNKGNQMNPEQYNQKKVVTGINSIFLSWHSSFLLQLPYHNYPSNVLCVFKIDAKLFKKMSGLAEGGKMLTRI